MTREEMPDDMIRVLVMLSKDGKVKTVFFTHDNKSPAKDFTVWGETIECDEVIINTLPTGFPSESHLRRI